MALGNGPIPEIVELRKAYEHAFSEVGTVMYLFIAGIVVLGIALALRYLWGSGKIYTIKPFDPAVDRKKVRVKRKKDRSNNSQTKA
jgi:hypothetical protein